MGGPPLLLLGHTQTIPATPSYPLSMEEEPSIVNLRALEDDIPELRFRLGALETELGLIVGNDDDDSDDYHGAGDDSDSWSVPTPPSFCARCSHCIRRSITVPFVFLVSVLVAVCVIIFCIFPASILLVIVVAVYYCCARDPIPFRVLLTAMLGSDGAGDADSPPARTVPEIHAAVIKRRCHGPFLASTEILQDDQLLLDLDDGTRLLFSKPLTEDEIEDSSDAAPWLLGELEDDDNRVHDDDESDVELGNKEEQLDNDTPKVVEQDSDIEKGETVEPQSVVEDDGDIEKGETAEPRSDTEVSPEQGNGTKEVPEEAPDHTGDVEINAGLPTPPTATASESMQEKTEKQQVVMQDDSESHSCDICLLPFEQGQIVAWSHNSQCEHAYHLDCITDWLIKQKSCPNCRADYLRKK